MKEYLRAVCLCAAIVVVVLFATGMVWYGYLVTAALFGLTRGETATAALGIALVAGAVCKTRRSEKEPGNRRGFVKWPSTFPTCRRNTRPRP